MISPETATNGIMSLVAEFGYERVPKALVGFSQGGYLAPSVHAIHGVSDSVFPLETAQAAHQKVLEFGFQGTFHSVEKGTHVANEAMGKILSELLFREQARLS